MTELSFSDFIEQAGVALEDGSFVSAKAVRVVEIIRDYDPGLEVEWIPRQHRIPGDDAIRIVDTRAHGLARTIMSFRDEETFTQRDGAWVLERLFLADGAKNDPVARMEAGNAALRALELKETLDLRAEGRELLTSALRSPLNRYRYTDPAGTLMEIRDGDPTARPVPGPQVIG